jgi:magnesium transporter
MNVRIKPEKYLRYLYLPNLFGTQRTKEILHVNPTIIPYREEAKEVLVYAFCYDANFLEEKRLLTVEDGFQYRDSSRTTWINVMGFERRK